MPSKTPIKRRDWFIIAIGALILAVLVIITIREVSPPSKQSEGVSSPATNSAHTFTVEYKVIGVGLVGRILKLSPGLVS
jgi:voltage-gated potassium channel Kch